MGFAISVVNKTGRPMNDISPRVYRQLSAKKTGDYAVIPGPARIFVEGEILIYFSPGTEEEATAQVTAVFNAALGADGWEVSGIRWAEIRLTIDVRISAGAAQVLDSVRAAFIGFCERYGLVGMEVTLEQDEHLLFQITKRGVGQKVFEIFAGQALGRIDIGDSKIVAKEELM